MRMTLELTDREHERVVYAAGVHESSAETLAHDAVVDRAEAICATAGQHRMVRTVQAVSEQHARLLGYRDGGNGDKPEIGRRLLDGPKTKKRGRKAAKA